MQYHNLANLFPMMTENERAALVDDMRQNGYDQTAPVVVYEGKILDGRNRWEASKQLGIDAPTIDYDGDDPLGYVIRHNLTRRHLNESQRAVVAGRLATMKQGQRTDLEPSANFPKVSQEKAAEMLNVSDRTIRTVKAVERQAPELIQEIESGKLNAHQAQQIAKLPEPQRAVVLPRVVGGESVSTAVREVKRDEVVSKLESIKVQEVKAAEGVYDVVVIDPPWPMEKIERDVTPNQVAFEYPTMTLQEIAQVEIPAADDCHLFLWTTQKFLPASLDLLKEWGFKYVLTFVWHKNGGFQPFGLPQYNCEFAVYARKGTPKFVDFKAFPTCFNASRTTHSAKPEEFYETLRRVTAGRRIDMFNRRAIDGFDTWGNEAQ